MTDTDIRQLHTQRSDANDVTAMPDIAIIDDASAARTVFAGLRPSAKLHGSSTREPHRFSYTMPIMLVSTLAMGMVVAGSADSAEATPQTAKKPDLRNSGKAAVRVAKVTTIPATYTVRPGDTVSGIAAKYGLRTADVLALNGLKSSSLIFPRQVLRLVPKSKSTKPQTTTTPATTTTTSGSSSSSPTSTKTYTIKPGDTVSRIAASFGLSTSVVLKANKLSWSSIIYPGHKLTIPITVDDSTTTPPTTPSTSDDSSSSTTDSDSESTPDTTPPVEKPPVVNGSYVIRSGDTITKIANKFGVTISHLLDANNLTRSSIIYAGHTLVIPGVATTTTTTASSGSGNVTLLNDEQEKNARTVIAVGRSLGVSDYGIVIALATAMQESSMRNLDYGHLDSLGLFQQRPSTGWGSKSQLTNTEYAAKLFYGGPKNPNKGKTRGLLDIPGWQSMSVTKAAQSVQISAYPNAYAKWEASARFWLSDLG
jgi:N-acetylmuramoyl-L-alanine amidase